MSIVLNGTTGITTPNVSTDTSTLGPLTQALNLGSTGQIVFPATQNASSNPNTLDDYEEGIWTPVFTGNGTINGAGKAYSGRYTKIGRVVTVIFNATSTDQNLQVVGYAEFSGLPFAPAVSDSAGAVTTEDIDVFARNGFCAAAPTARLYLSACGSAGGTNNLFATTTYFAAS